MFSAVVYKLVKKIIKGLKVMQYFWIAKFVRVDDMASLKKIARNQLVDLIFEHLSRVLSDLMRFYQKKNCLRVKNESKDNLFRCPLRFFSPFSFI